MRLNTPVQPGAGVPQVDGMDATNEGDFFVRSGPGTVKLPPVCFHPESCNSCGKGLSQREETADGVGRCRSMA